jgi:hypothetical protein
MNFRSLVVLSISILACDAAMAAEAVPVAPAPKAPAVSVDAMPSVTSAKPLNKAGDAGASARTRAASATPHRPGTDRLDLDTTVVTGNRELPKVLYIVPWKRAQLGELPSQPLNSLLDEVLAPVDRDVFRREVTYYGALADPAGAAKGAPAGSAAGSEK